MVEAIVTALTAKLRTLNLFNEVYCLAELREDGDGRKVPYANVGGGEYTPVNIDSGSVLYFRHDGEGSDELIQDPYQAGTFRKAVWPLRLVAMAHRTDAFSPSRIADQISTALSTAEDDIALMLSLDDVTLEVSAKDLDTPSVFTTEFNGIADSDLVYTRLMVSMRLTVTVQGSADCWPNPCDLDTDILHYFDFCDTSTFNRLTEQQKECLSDQLCDTPQTLCEQLADVAPEDVVADVFDCLTEDAQDALGAAICEPTPCDPVTLEINEEFIGSQPSGGAFNINVTLDGLKSGSWDGVDTWEVTSAPCPDGSAVLRNTVPTTLSTTPVPSGGSVNITAPDAVAVLKDTANNTLSTTPIPSNVTADIIAPDGTVTLNSLPYGSVRSGGTLDVVTAAPSLSVSTSSATPNFGASVTLTATATGFTPTTYTWYANGNQIGTGASLAWTVNIAGAIDIVCVATDGTLTAQGTASITSIIVAQSVCYLDGVNDGFSFTALPDDHDLGALTFRFRFLSEATGSSWPLSIVSNQAMGELLRLNITTTQAIAYVWTGTGFLIGTANYLVGQWNELTFSRKTNSTITADNVTRIWLNGSLVTSAINTGSPAAQFTAFFGQTIYGNTKMKVKALTLFQGITDNAGAAALAAQADNDYPAASGLTLVEHVPFTQAPFTPSTVQPLSRANGITGRGFCQFNANFASPFGLVAP